MQLTLRVGLVAVLALCGACSDDDSGGGGGGSGAAGGSGGSGAAGGSAGSAASGGSGASGGSAGSGASGGSSGGAGAGGVAAVEAVDCASVTGATMVNITGNPMPINVGAGDTVMWSSGNSETHTATSGFAANGPDGFFDTGSIAPGESKCVRFNSAATYPYFCSIHTTQLGAVIVQ